MDVTTFRVDYPEFGVSPGMGAFTDTMIDRWLVIGRLILNANRWATLLDHGLELFVAHHLTMDKTNQLAAAVGGNIGQTAGPLASKTVDKVSAAYTTGAVTIENAGHWNLTTYGLQFQQLARCMGAGGIQI